MNYVNQCDILNTLRCESDAKTLSLLFLFDLFNNMFELILKCKFIRNKKKFSTLYDEYVYFFLL